MLKSCHSHNLLSGAALNILRTLFNFENIYCLLNLRILHVRVFISFVMWRHNSCMYYFNHGYDWRDFHTNILRILLPYLEGIAEDRPIFNWIYCHCKEKWRTRKALLTYLFIWGIDQKIYYSFFLIWTVCSANRWN